MTAKRIHFVTDSTCDIPADMLARYPITVIPCYINYGNESYADDGVELVRETYYQQLASIHPFPSTAAMSPGLVETTAKRAIQEADHLIVTCVSSRLSAVYSAMKLGLGALSPNQYTLLDSESMSMGMGWQVVIGAETAAETGDVARVVDAMTRVRKTQRVYAALPTLEFLHRSGRVTWAAASLSALLQIKPIISLLEGEVKSVAKVRTFTRAFEELIVLIQAEAPLDRLAILYANDYALAQTLLERLQTIAPPGTFLCRITPTIGTNIGPGGIGVATVSQKWRD